MYNIHLLIYILIFFENHNIVFLNTLFSWLFLFLETILLVLISPKSILLKLFVNFVKYFSWNIFVLSSQHSYQYFHYVYDCIGTMVSISIIVQNIFIIFILLLSVYVVLRKFIISNTSISNGYQILPRY